MLVDGGCVKGRLPRVFIAGQLANLQPSGFDRLKNRGVAEDYAESSLPIGYRK